MERVIENMNLTIGKPVEPLFALPASAKRGSICPSCVAGRLNRIAVKLDMRASPRVNIINAPCPHVAIA
jgi:hypothetical protein